MLSLLLTCTVLCVILLLICKVSCVILLMILRLVFVLIKPGLRAAAGVLCILFIASFFLSSRNETPKTVVYHEHTAAPSSVSGDISVDLN